MWQSLFPAKVNEGCRSGFQPEFIFRLSITRGKVTHRVTSMHQLGSNNRPWICKSINFELI